RSGGITKRGNRYLRKQLVHGARAVLFRYRNKQDQLSRWGSQLVARRGIQKACVAMAARMARLIWVLLQRQEGYKPRLESRSYRRFLPEVADMLMNKAVNPP